MSIDTLTPEQMAQCREDKRYFRGEYSGYPSEACENAVCIPLTRSRHTLIDAEDFDRIAVYLWHTSGTGYAKTDIRNAITNTHFLMHREVMRCPDDRVIDHIDGNKLDNRKGNLRICTGAENARSRRKSWKSSSQYKGVKKHQDRWRAYISVNNVDKHIGLYRDEAEAAHAYNRAAMEHYGEFAVINKIEVRANA
jgi:hypothetical protein